MAFYFIFVNATLLHYNNTSVYHHHTGIQQDVTFDVSFSIWLRLKLSSWPNDLPNVIRRVFIKSVYLYAGKRFLAILISSPLTYS